MNTELQKKLERFCAYQERCKQDIWRKVAELRGDITYGRIACMVDFTDKDVAEVIDYLEREKFIDENRFAQIYAVSKLRQKQWGKYKIKAHLKAKNISIKNIQDAIDTLDLEEYDAIHKKLIETKSEQAAFAHGF